MLRGTARGCLMLQQVTAAVPGLVFLFSPYIQGWPSQGTAHVTPKESAGIGERIPAHPSHRLLPPLSLLNLLQSHVRTPALVQSWRMRIRGEEQGSSARPGRRHQGIHHALVTLSKFCPFSELHCTCSSASSLLCPYSIPSPRATLTSIEYDPHTRESFPHSFRTAPQQEELSTISSPDLFLSRETHIFYSC